MIRLAALAAALLAGLPSVAAAAPDPPDPGETTAGTVVSNGVAIRHGRVRLPATHRTRTRVVVRGKGFTRRRAYHGCGP